MQRSRSEYNLLKANTYTDDDSGISNDYDYSSSSDLNSSRMTLINEPRLITQQSKHIRQTPFVRYTSDGIIERIRPVTMRNSQNGDYIICNTKRGTYIAYRTPIVPIWVTQLVHEIELRGK
ncbi:hypothetical protein I4U23_018195 [Adineta vaga]|nr:hypothetical protein I4U23_018195 [Adineta vaga]